MFSCWWTVVVGWSSTAASGWAGRSCVGRDVDAGWSRMARRASARVGSVSPAKRRRTSAARMASDDAALAAADRMRRRSWDPPALSTTCGVLSPIARRRPCSARAVWKAAPVSDDLQAAKVAVATSCFETPVRSALYRSAGVMTARAREPSSNPAAIIAAATSARPSRVATVAARTLCAPLVSAAPVSTSAMRLTAS